MRLHCPTNAPVAQGIEHQLAELGVARSNRAGRIDRLDQDGPRERVVFVLRFDVSGCDPERERTARGEPRAVADAPEGIKLGRYRDMQGRGWHIWVRRGLFGLLALFVFAGLFNAFGQRPSTARASSPEAELQISSPTRVRGGLLWEARFTIRANQELKQATLVLSQGWLEGNTINTIEPSPVGEASRNGSLSLDLGHVPAGERHVLYIQFQTNPANVARRSVDVQLQDGEKLLLSVHRTLTTFP
jgi:hypothetical protein